MLADGGAVSRAEADEKAEREYEQFAVRRRSHREAQAEYEAMREIEQAAKNLPSSHKSAKR